MSTQHEAAGAQAPGSRGGGRSGRGGGRPSGRPTRSAVATSKVATAKIGPTRLLEADWTKEAAIKSSSFVIWLGTGNAGDQQMTFHRPIGETLLTQSQWVATPTRDISFLLQRKESEELASWKRKSEQAKRIAVLRARQGRMYTTTSEETEAWTFDGSPAIQPTIRTCMAAARAANAQESAWLDYADTAVRVAEQQFKEALRRQVIPPGWVRANPRPIHETMGGALGDIHQTSVEYLNGLTLAAAKDKVLKVALGLTSTDPIALPEESDEEEEEEDKSPPSPKAATSPKAKERSVSPPKEESTVRPPIPTWDEQVKEEEKTAKVSPPRKIAGKTSSSGSK